MGRKKKYVDLETYYNYAKELAEKLASLGETQPVMTKELLIYVMSDDEFQKMMMVFIYGKGQEVKTEDKMWEINSQELVDMFWKEEESTDA